MKRLLICLGCTLALAIQAQLGPLAPEAVEREGQALATRLRSLQPIEGATNTATLRIRSKTNTVEVPLRIEVSVCGTNWVTSYLANPQDGANQTWFSISRNNHGTNEYHVRREIGDSVQHEHPSGPDLMAPFTDSDFWLADLGMEFLHWPTQRLLRKEIRRGQSCDKLESIAPPGHTNGYVRVVSWFDIDTGGPVICEAYDAKGKMVKEFKPNDFTKVDGQWRVEELEMRDLRTGSRSFIRFHLKD